MQKESLNSSAFAKGVGAAAILAVSLGSLAIGDYSPNAVSYSFVPGTYSASAKGMESDVVVTITVDNSSITDVSVDVSGETQGIGAAIGDEITAQILEAQSSAVDGVSGASVSSDAVREALDAAIEKAQNGDTSDAVTSGGEEAVTETAVDEAEAVSEAASAENSSVAAGSYTPGTYTASAAGMESDVTVTITVDESSITDVTVDVSGETDGIGAAIGDEVSAQILDAQSADISGVSGASVSSDAVRTALADALAQASAGAAEAVTEGASDDNNSTTAGSYTPGTYTASATGMESDVTVTITVDESSITDVTVDVSGETDGIGAAIGDEVSAQILDAQSADISGVSGASVSSDAVRTALADALAQASAGAAEAAESVDEEAGEPDQEASTEVISAEEAAEEEIPAGYGVAVMDGSGETYHIPTDEELADLLAANVSETASAASAETAEEETEKAAAESDAEPVVIDETKSGVGVAEAADAAEDDAASETGGYTPGTYTASAAGMESDVTVTVTVDESSITDVTVDVSGETDGIGAAIGDEVIAQILEAQSADISGVSGATVSSTAVTAALTDALAQAQAGTAASDGSVSEAVENADETASDIPAGYGIAVREGSGETYTLPAAAETAAQTDEVEETETEAAADDGAEDETETEYTVDESKAGVGVAELS